MTTWVDALASLDYVLGRRLIADLLVRRSSLARLTYCGDGSAFVIRLVWGLGVA